MYRRGAGHRPTASRRWQQNPGGTIWLETVKRMGPVAFYHGANATYDGSNLVSSWTDLSGNGRHATQSTAGDKPTLDTSGADAFLLFDNDDTTNGKRLAANSAASALSGKAGATLFIAVRALDDTEAYIVYVTDHGEDGFALKRGGAGAITCYVSELASATADGAFSQDEDHIVCVRFDGSEATSTDRVRIWVDGSEVAVTGADNPSSLPPLAALQIGRRGTASPFDCYLYSGVLFARALPTSDLATMDNAFRQGLAFYG